MLGKKITVTVAQPEVQLAGEGRKVLYKGSVALGDHSSPKPVYLISYGDPKPEQPATVIAVVSSKGKEQFVAAPENTVYYAPEIRSVIEKAEGRPPERVSCLYEKSCGAVVYQMCIRDRYSARHFSILAILLSLPSNFTSLAM